MVVTVVNSFTAVPIFMVYAIAFSPFLMMDISVIVVVVVMVVIVVIFGECNSSGNEDYSEHGESKSLPNAVHQTSWQI